MKVTREDVQRVLDANPTLSDYGSRPPAGSMSDRFDLARERQRLLGDLDEIQRCVDWFEKASLNRHVYGSSPSSYGVKHRIEATIGGYVSNGACIVAAYLVGVPLSDDGGPNPAMGIALNWYYRQSGVR